MANTSSGKIVQKLIQIQFLYKKTETQGRKQTARPFYNGRAAGNAHRLVLGQLIQIAHGESRHYKRHMNDHVIIQLVVGDVLRIHKYFEQMD